MNKLKLIMPKQGCPLACKKIKIANLNYLRSTNTRSTRFSPKLVKWKLVRCLEQCSENLKSKWCKRSRKWAQQGRDRPTFTRLRQNPLSAISTMRNHRSLKSLALQSMFRRTRRLWSNPLAQKQCSWCRRSDVRKSWLRRLGSRKRSVRNASVNNVRKR